MNSIPIDLIHEISSRLPIKSIGRFRCVSELWRSILCGPDFTELFLTRSSARPRLLFVMKGFDCNEWIFFSSPQAHRQREKSSLTKDFHLADLTLKLRGDMWVYLCGRASGLFCFHQQKLEDRVHVICNPTTGQYCFLHKLRTWSRSFLGFDPIDKIFKVVSVASCASDYRILSLGTGIMSWRKIQCPLTHNPWLSQGICINGVLYYRAQHIDDQSYLIVCFYVRSEKFKFVHAGFTNGYMCTELINCKGRLGVIGWLKKTGGRLTHEWRMWVLEDAEKQDWSEYAYTLPDHNLGDAEFQFSVAGVTATGEIVIFRTDIYSRSEHVFYFHPERNTIQRVEVEGFEIRGRVYAFVDHVDDLTFPIKPHQQQDRLPVESSNKFDRFKSINKFDALCLLDDV